jgi:His-Xaa-Ser system protein HxsD
MDAVIDAILDAARQRALTEAEVQVLQQRLEFPERYTRLLQVNTDVYPLAAIHRVLYWFSGELPLKLEPVTAEQLAILAPAESVEAGEIANLRVRLLTALNDFAVRVDIEEKTAVVRDTLVRTALGEALGSSHGACV